MLVYNDHIMSKLSASQKAEWSEFQQILPRLEENQIYVQIHVVPKTEEFRYLFNDTSMNLTDEAKLIVVLLVDPSGHCVLLQDDDIAIDHSHILGTKRENLLQLLDDKPWFMWNGDQDDRMYLVLE